MRICADPHIVSIEPRPRAHVRKYSRCAGSGPEPASHLQPPRPKQAVEVVPTGPFIDELGGRVPIGISRFLSGAGRPPTGRSDDPR